MRNQMWNFTIVSLLLAALTIPVQAYAITPLLGSVVTDHGVYTLTFPTTLTLTTPAGARSIALPTQGPLPLQAPWTLIETDSGAGLVWGSQTADKKMHAFVT